MRATSPASSTSASTPANGRSDATHWDGMVKALHWTLALVILIEVPAGYVMSRTYGASFKDAGILKVHILASQFHHTLGFLVLAGVLLWIARRLHRGRPVWDRAMPRAQRLLASSVHGLLLLLLVAIPWSGWTAISALADSPSYGTTHLWFFGFDRLLPRIWEPLPFNDPNGYALFGKLHRWGLWAGLALLTLHVASAIWHHAVARDGVLRRMWPLGDGPLR